MENPMYMRKIEFQMVITMIKFKCLFVVACIFLTQSAFGQVLQRSETSRFVGNNRDLDSLFECFQQDSSIQTNLKSFFNTLNNDGAVSLARRVVERQINDLTTRTNAGLMDAYFDELGARPPEFDARPSGLVPIAVKKFANNRSTHKGFKCLHQYLQESPRGGRRLDNLEAWGSGDSIFNRLKKLGDSMKESAEEKVCEIVRPRLLDVTTEALNDAITCDAGASCLLLSKLEHEQVASRVLTSYFKNQLTLANTNFAESQDFEFSVQDTPLRDLEDTLRALDPSAEGKPDLPAEIRNEYAVAIFRAMGHRYIDSNYHEHGGYFINQTVSVLQLSEGSMEKVSSAICGLVPEVGAAICSVLEVAIDATWNFGIIPGIESGIKEQFHKYIDVSMDDLSASLRGVPIERKDESYCGSSEERGFASAAVTFLQDTNGGVLNKNLSVHLKEFIPSMTDFTSNVIALNDSVSIDESPDTFSTSGAYNGTLPSDSLGLGLNNIGVFDPVSKLIYTCIETFTNGVPSPNGQTDTVFELVPQPPGLRVVDSRPFNPDKFLNERGELPACSGEFETTTNIYTDIFEVDKETFSATLIYDDVDQEFRPLIVTELNSN